MSETMISPNSTDTRGSPRFQSQVDAIRPHVLRHVPFTVLVCGLVAATLAILLQVDTTMQQASRVTVPPTPTKAAANSAVLSQTKTVRAPMSIFPSPDPQATLMQPVVDSQGYVWFGEMQANKLARLDPRTGEIKEWAPPGGRYGLMMSAIGPDGAIWFAEDNAGYIGRFYPVTERFTTFPLATYNGRSPEPEHLQFDRNGQLWFTLNRSGQIGLLDPASGVTHTWDVLPPDDGQARPYSLAVAPDGQIWFGAALRGGVVGKLDPQSGEVSLHQLAEPTAQVTTMVSDNRGSIWFTEMEFNRLGRIDTSTGTIVEIKVPEPTGDSSGIYALDIGPDGTVWFTTMRANAVVEYVPSTSQYTYYSLPVPKSIPYGLAAGGDTVWFIADGEPTNYVGRLFTAK